MRTISGALSEALSQQATTLCIIVDVTCLNGRKFYLSASDGDVTYGGNTYKASQGCNVSQVRTVLGTDAESVGIDVLVTKTGISGVVIESGMLDAATLRVLIIDFNAPTSVVNFFQGFINKVSYKDRLTATIDSGPLLATAVDLASDVYSSNCRADFGDNKCKASFVNRMGNATVTEVDNAQSFSYSNAAATNDVDHTYQNGLAIFNTGENAGISMEIADQLRGPLGQSKCVLRGLLPYPLAIGDEITVYYGCDKTPAMCSQRYNNIANFRGEPFTVAPWLVTSAASDATATGAGSDTGTSAGKSTSSQDTTLYLYTLQSYQNNIAPPDHVLAVNTLLSLKAIMVDHTRVPSWGPIGDQWNFAGVTENIGGKLNVGFHQTLYFIATKITAVSIFGQAFEAGVLTETQLTDDQAARVRLKYPKA